RPGLLRGVQPGPEQPGPGQGDQAAAAADRGVQSRQDLADPGRCGDRVRLRPGPARLPAERRHPGESRRRGPPRQPGRDPGTGRPAHAGPDPGIPGRAAGECPYTQHRPRPEVPDPGLRPRARRNRAPAVTSGRGRLGTLVSVEMNVRETMGSSNPGKLRIYLGSAAGVGKTYAMLCEGHRRAERGTDVVVGFVETHGRPHTAELIEGLEVVPRARLPYRGTTFE